MPARDVEAAKKLIEEAGIPYATTALLLRPTMDIFESGNFKDIAQIVKEKPEGYRRQRHAEYHGNGGLAG